MKPNAECRDADERKLGGKRRLQPVASSRATVAAISHLVAAELVANPVHRALARTGALVGADRCGPVAPRGGGRLVLGIVSSATSADVADGSDGVVGLVETFELLVEAEDCSLRGLVDVSCSAAARGKWRLVGGARGDAADGGAVAVGEGGGGGGVASSAAAGVDAGSGGWEGLGEVVARHSEMKG